MKRMILSALCITATQLSFANPLTSTIQVPVPNGGVVAPAGGVLGVPLNGYLIPNTLYDVTCHVSNPNMPDSIILRLGHQGTYCPTMGGCGGYIVNGKYPPSNQVAFTNADNTITFTKTLVVDYDQTGALLFTNLDMTSTAVVSNCEAKPTI